MWTTWKCCDYTIKSGCPCPVCSREEYQKANAKPLIKLSPGVVDYHGPEGPGTTEGRKDDTAKKWRPGLIAPEFIRGIAHVLAFGANKYSAGNWALGMDWSRPIDALDRHWTAWKGGEKYDEETGYSHLWHMGCCLMFLVAYEARGIGRDNRIEVGLMAEPTKEQVR